MSTKTYTLESDPNYLPRPGLPFDRSKWEELWKLLSESLKSTQERIDYFLTDTVRFGGSDHTGMLTTESKWTERRADEMRTWKESLEKGIAEAQKITNEYPELKISAILEDLTSADHAQFKAGYQARVKTSDYGLSYVRKCELVKILTKSSSRMIEDSLVAPSSGTSRTSDSGMTGGSSPQMTGRRDQRDDFSMGSVCNTIEGASAFASFDSRPPSPEPQTAHSSR